MSQGTEIYNESADELSDYYDRIGPRYGDIELAFADAGNPENPVVLEVGCGNGRDAKVITSHTPYYTGIDSSDKMLEKAHERLPNAQFEQADARTYSYPGTYDIVFAFAPFRHMDIDEVTTVLRKIYDSLRVGGVLYISSNYGEKYEETELPHPYGIRKIYKYNPLIIQKHAPHGFKVIREQKDEVNNETWFELSLRKAV
jgi:SAM-dependent methyltransferase